MSTDVLFANNDDEARIIEIQYPKSYDVKTYQDKVNGVLGVIFKVHLTFPSKEVLYFYDNKLKEIGWTPFCEPYYIENDRKWQKYIMWPVEGDALKHQLKHQLLAKWVNKDKTRMLLLAIVYYSKNITKEEQINAAKPNNDLQVVILQFMPFIILPPPSIGK
jgi:hypothetical protein